MAFCILHKFHQYNPSKFPRLDHMLPGYYIFTYGFIRWGRSSLTSTSELQKSQNILIKLMYGSTDNFFSKRNDLLTFNQLYDFSAPISFITN